MIEKIKFSRKIKTVNPQEDRRYKVGTVKGINSRNQMEIDCNGLIEKIDPNFLVDDEGVYRRIKDLKKGVWVLVSDRYIFR